MHPHKMQCSYIRYICIHQYISILCMFAVVCDLQAGRVGLATAEVLAVKLPSFLPSGVSFPHQST